MNIEGFDTDLEKAEYRQSFIKPFVQRIQFIESRLSYNGGVDALPAEAVKSLYAVISQLHSTLSENEVSEMKSDDQSMVHP